MKSYHLILVCILFILPNCDSQIEVIEEWQELDAKLEPVLELGTDSTFFSHPAFLVTDSKSNIIVADKGLNKLLVFNRKGSFLFDIGKRGKGPAEFRSIAGMKINTKDEITVFDRSSQTFKKFKSSGEYITSYKFDNPFNSNIEFAEWDNFKLLFYSNYTTDISSSNYLHVYSNNKLVEEAISVQELKNLDDESLLLTVRDTGSNLVTDKNNLIFAPYIYNGMIYEYAFENNSGNDLSIKLVNKEQGLIHKQPLSISSGNSKKYADANLTIHGEEKQVFLYNQSKGLFRLNDGKIVHFTYIENDEKEKRTFGVEVYNDKMKAIGYGPIFSKEFNSSNRLLGWDVEWKDQDDRFYIIDRSDVPKIRVAKLRFNDL